MTPGRTVPADVVVVGAGSAGCAAALAAARAGARTVLVDRLPFVGGTSTAVLDTFYAFYTAGSDPVRLVGGIGQQVAAELERRGAAFTRPNTFGSGLGITYDPEQLKLVWDDLLADAGVRVLPSATAYAAEPEPEWTTVDVAARGGPLRLRAHTVVDASGDGELSVLLGGEVLADQELTQPATMTFKVAGVDMAAAFRAPGRRPLRELITEAVADGYPLPGSSGSLHRTPHPGVVHVAMTRVPSPVPDDPDSWRAAEVAARRQLGDCLRFLRDRVPGFADAALIGTSATLGVRETRRIAGRQVLAEKEILAGTVPADTIALCGAPIEDLSTPETRWVHIGAPGYYGIPLDCLRPAGLAGALVAGRCFSADHGAHSSARSMGTCLALGQAAGTTAALAVARGVPAAGVSPDLVRERLAGGGAILAVDR